MGNALNTKDSLIGPYRVLAHLGTGGMGEVLKVMDTRSQRVAALKLQAPLGRDSDAGLLNFRREQRALARCDHPNIVRLLDHGQLENRPYLVLELVEGKNLDEFVSLRLPEPSPSRDRLASLLAIQLASALDHLHTLNLIHRDLKPGNVLVTQDEVVKLIDFGIAQELEKALDPADADMAGTYAFCSPEQVSEVALDHRSDLYSLGVVLYLLLTNHLPFEADNPLAFIVKHVTQAPTPLEKYHPRVPVPLRDVVLRLLAKKPADRFQSSLEVEHRLRDYVDQLERKAPRLRVGLAAANRPLFEPAFVGRVQELVQLEGIISLLQAGSAEALLILGESGLGKSRLIDEALAGARPRDVNVISARCLPHAERPYQGILEVVEAMLGQVWSQPRELLQTMLGAHLPVLARIFPALESLLSVRLPHLPELSPRAELERTQAALKTFLEVVPTRPTVVALKDLHYADPATLAFIATFCTSARPAMAQPLLLVASVSTDELGASHSLNPWLTHPPPSVGLLELSRLAPGEVERMVQSMLGAELELGLLPMELSEVCRGNPLHVSEAVMGLMDDGRLVREEGGGEGPGRLEVQVSSLPAREGQPFIPSIDQLLAQRLARVPDDCLGLLEWMAVLDRPCNFDWLRDITGLSTDALLERLEVLVSKHILLERVSKARTILSFHHPRMAAAMRERLAPDRRLELHRGIARSWLKRYGDVDLLAIDTAARHFYLGEAWSEAAPYLRRSSESHLHLGLFEPALRQLQEAQHCYRQAGQLEPRLEIQLELQLSQALTGLDQTDEAMQRLERCYALAQHGGFGDLEVRVLFAMASLSALLGDTRASARQYAGSLRLVRAMGDTMGLLKSLLGLGESLLFIADAPRARQALEEAQLQATALGDGPLLARVTRGLAMASLLQGQLLEAGELLARAVDRLPPGDELRASCQLWEAELKRLRGDLGGAAGAAGAALESLERIGDLRQVTQGLLQLAAISLDIQELDRAEALLSRGAELSRKATQTWLRVMRHILLGRLGLQRNRAADARQALEGAVQLAEAHQLKELAARARRFLAAARIRGGAFQEGQVLAQQAIAESEALGNLPGALEARMVLAEGLVVQREREEAWKQLEGVVSQAESHGLGLLAVRALTLRGRLAADLGQVTAAQQLLRHAWIRSSDIAAGLTPTQRACFETRPEIMLLKNTPLLVGIRS